MFIDVLHAWRRVQQLVIDSLNTGHDNTGAEILCSTQCTLPQPFT